MDSDSFLKILGNRIRALRKSRKISQEKLAELSGLHPTYVSNIENGKVNASINSYNALASALEVPLAELLPISSGGIDLEIEKNIIELLGLIRNLSKKKQVIFLSASKGIIAGLEKAR